MKQKIDPSTTHIESSIFIRRPAMFLAGLLMLIGSVGCLRFEESNFDSTGVGALWPLLFVSDLFVLGQQSPSTVEGIRLGFQRPRHMTIVNNRLIISDEKNRRVLIYNSVPTTGASSLRVQPDIILGAPDANTGGVDAYEYPNDNLHINDPTGVASDGTRLFVADQSRNRVLVWNTFPTASYTPADMVLGQADFTSGSTLAAAANTMNSPEGVAICGTKLLVADQQNHRVMVWNTLPTTGNAGADFVLGQTNFTNNTPGATGATTLNSPVGIDCTATQLFVADAGNNRVLIWNTIPTTMGAGANTAVGQVGLAASAPQTLVNGLSNPQFVHAGSNNKLYVSDTANNRVMIYDPIPAASNENADTVLGQNNFNNSAQDNTSLANGMDGPGAITYYGNQILFLDSSNNRMMIWNSELPSIFQAADAVLGQPDLLSERQNYEPLSATSFSHALDVISDGTRLYITSDADNRMLVYDSVPTSSIAAAANVQGQPDFSSFLADNGGVTSQSMNQPGGACIADGRLFLADTGSNRILIWNTIPASTRVAADLVLGQTGFNTNGSGTTNSNFDAPFGLYCDSQRLILADSSNNRVLIWNSLPGATNQPADVVIGQSAFNTSTSGGGANGLNTPRIADVIEDKLVIADSGNHRVLIFNSIPTSNGASADLVIGQSDFASVALNGGAANTNISGMNSPSGLAYIDGALLVSELFNNRILIWRGMPTTNGQTPDLVYGQPDFDSGLPNNGGLSGERFNVPFGMQYDAGTNYLFVGDVFNYRVVAIPVSRLGL